MMGNYFSSVRINWSLAWRHKDFRYKAFSAILLMSVILSCFPVFFQYIENRKGAVLNDPVLQWIPVHDVYLFLFILVWSCALLILIAAVRSPSVFLTFLLAYILLSLTRMASIFLFPLEPPAGIISLVDPLTNHFYGARFVTRDLFFSGHVSTGFLMYLCHREKFSKYYTLISCCIVSILVLVQHIHYSVDVLFAFPIAYVCYRCAKVINRPNYP